MHKAVRTVLQAVKPTPRCGALDDDKKAMVIVLIGQGASRREAANLVKCHHTTIGRTAARDAAFGAKLEQVEAATHLEAGDMIRRAASDPKYWRAAAWMLERRNPEDYGRRDPTTFTGDQVTSLLASFCNEVQKLVPQEKTAELQRLFDDVLDEIEAKSGPAKEEQESKEPEKQTAHVAQEMPSSNGHHATNGVAVSPVTTNGNGHVAQAECDPSHFAPAEPAATNGKPHAMADDVEPIAEPEEYVDASLEDEAGDFEPVGDDDLEPLDDADVPPELLHLRQELNDELAAHIGGYATTPPSRAARDVLRHISRRFVHHPRHRVAAGLAKDALRKVFDVNNLHQQSTSCTTAPNTEGRCTNGANVPGQEEFGSSNEGAIANGR
jgi:hypothetical protein